MSNRISELSNTTCELDRLVGCVVVLDAEGRYVYVGTFVRYDDHFLTLEEADVHDLRDAKTTRELYIVETKMHGIRPNRKQVIVRRDTIISVSALDDVVL